MRTLGCLAFACALIGACSGDPAQTPAAPGPPPTAAGDDGGAPTSTSPAPGATETEASPTSQGPPGPSSGTDVPVERGVSCDGEPLLPLPADPALQGPWPVGARTATIDGLTFEVWYPAVPGSEQGLTSHAYDLRAQLPEGQRTRVSDADNPLQPCDCFRDLPIDERHGPYGVVLFVHGSAGVRTQNLSQMTHWASRGFVVVAADHPNLRLMDVAGLFGPVSLAVANPSAEVGLLLDALDRSSAPIDFLSGNIDMEKLAFSGQSRGGSEFQGYANRGRVFMPMVSSLAASPDEGVLESTLFLGGLDDTIGAYSDQQRLYEQSPATKRLVGLDRAGHVSFTDMCGLGRESGGLLAIAQAAGVGVGPFVESLATDGCGEDQLAPEVARDIINFATAAALEEVLRCDARMTEQLANIQSRFSDVAEYREER